MRPISYNLNPDRRCTRLLLLLLQRSLLARALTH